MLNLGFALPLANSPHTGRGIGFYSQRLQASLETLSSDFSVHLVSSSNLSVLSGCDLVIFPYFELFHPSFPLSLAAKSLVVIHDLIPLDYPDHYPPGFRGRLAWLYQSLVLRQVKAVITVSQASLMAIKRLTGLPHSRLHLIYEAADPIFTPIKDRARLRAIAVNFQLPPKFIFYVGDVNWNKNLPGLVHACLEANLPLVIAGKTAARLEELDLRHPELRHLQDLLPDLHHPLIHRIGFVPDTDLPLLYNLATVYCQPSFAEGFGLSVIEAMACGTPVVCSQTYSLPEVGGSAVVYFDPLSANLASLLSQVYNSPSLQRSLAHRGLVQAQKFSWSQTATDFLQLVTDPSFYAA